MCRAALEMVLKKHYDADYSEAVQAEHYEAIIYLMTISALKSMG
jgi:hypothetical protein